MKNKTCCFTGHREIDAYEYLSIKKELKNEIIKLIEKGVCFFGAGGARGFDALAAKTVLELKNEYPHIKLILVLPCADQTRGWKIDDRIEHEMIKKNADKVRVLATEYYRGCMQARNRHLVKHSAFCIYYKRRESGGTAYTVEYAKKQKLVMISL